MIEQNLKENKKVQQIENSNNRRQLVKSGFVIQRNDPNRLQDRPLIGFRPEEDILGFLNSLGENGERSKFINDAIKMKIYSQTNVKRLLEELRIRHPREWAYINRRKFYPGGKF